MESTGEWLQQIPLDRPFVIWALVLVCLVSVARLFLERSTSGRTALRLLHAFEGGFLALLLSLMILLSFLQIVLRNLGHGGFIWIDPLLRHLLLWIAFVGASLSSRVGRHISIDALSQVLPPAALRVSRVSTHLLASIVCLLLSNACLKMVVEEATGGLRGFLDLPVWMLQSIMPIAFLLMSSRFLGHTLKTWRSAEIAPSTVEGSA